MAVGDADAGSDAPLPGVADGDALAHPLATSNKAVPATARIKR